MLRHLPRLLTLWRVAARYRLDTLLPLPPHPLLSLLLLLFRLHPAWWFAGADGHVLLPVHRVRDRESVRHLGQPRPSGP